MIRSLLSYPCKYGMRALLSSLPYKIKADFERETWHDYVARCLRMTAENTAKISGGGYIKVEYADLINCKPEDTRTSEEIISTMKEKLRQIGGENE